MEEGESSQVLLDDPDEVMLEGSDEEFDGLGEVEDPLGEVEDPVDGGCGTYGIEINKYSLYILQAWDWKSGHPVHFLTPLFPGQPTSFASTITTTSLYWAPSPSSTVPSPSSMEPPRVSSSKFETAWSTQLTPPTIHSFIPPAILGPTQTPPRQLCRHFSFVFHR